MNSVSDQSWNLLLPTIRFGAENLFKAPEEDTSPPTALGEESGEVHTRVQGPALTVSIQTTRCRFPPRPAEGQRRQERT